jgi:excisionase family DNA binding protein
MDFITTKEAAKKWGITDRMVIYYCSSDRIIGAVKLGNLWLIPKDANKPMDGRSKESKVKKDE